MTGRPTRALGHALLALLALLALAGTAPARADSPLAAVVGVAARVPDDARTLDVLGRHRFGSGVVIDGAGLVVTAGYLVLEADEVKLVLGEEGIVEADVLAYDNATGLGLLRAREALEIKPMRLAEAAPDAAGTPLLVVAHGGDAGVQPGLLVARREFAGYWEYLLEDALFVAPPHPRFAGAALVDARGHLAGVGSLVTRHVAEDGTRARSSLFIPAPLLRDVLPGLLAEGRSDSPPRPWLGLYLGDNGGLIAVSRVAEDGPAEAAGIVIGDVIAGVDGEPVADLAALYRRVWATGAAGVSVRLDVLRQGDMRQVEVVTRDRYDWLRLAPQN